MNRIYQTKAFKILSLALAIGVGATLLYLSATNKEADAPNAEPQKEQATAKQPKSTHVPLIPKKTAKTSDEPSFLPSSKAVSGYKKTLPPDNSTNEEKSTQFPIDDKYLSTSKSGLPIKPKPKNPLQEKTNQQQEPIQKPSEK